jgi:hypothetical protein
MERGVWSPDSSHSRKAGDCSNWKRSSADGQKPAPIKKGRNLCAAFFSLTTSNYTQYIAICQEWGRLKPLVVLLYGLQASQHPL